MNKNVDSLNDTNPGRAYSTLEKIGDQPDNCSDSNTFTLPSHMSDNLTPHQSADRIANHFANIYNQFPPLSVEKLPASVQQLSLTTSTIRKEYGILP